MAALAALQRVTVSLPRHCTGGRQSWQDDLLPGSIQGTDIRARTRRQGKVCWTCNLVAIARLRIGVCRSLFLNKEDSQAAYSNRRAGHLLSPWTRAALLWQRCICNAELQRWQGTGTS